MKILKGRGQEYKGVFITDKFDKKLDDFLTADNVTFNRFNVDKLSDVKDIVYFDEEFKIYFGEFKNN